MDGHNLAGVGMCSSEKQKSHSSRRRNLISKRRRTRIDVKQDLPSRELPEDLEKSTGK